MGWIERFRSTSRPSKETAASCFGQEQDSVLAPPQTTPVAYSEDAHEQGTFNRPGAPRMVRPARSESSVAAAQAYSCSISPLQSGQLSCSHQQLAGERLSNHHAPYECNSHGCDISGAQADSAQQPQQLIDLQLCASAAANAAGAKAEELVGLQQHLHSSSMPAVFRSSSATRRPPARHASFDAGYVQHRAMTAVASLAHYPRTRGGSTCGFAEFLSPLSPAAAVEMGYVRTVSSISNSSGSNPAAAAATASNEDIEIGWVWPPCLASDAGPVEFAVNVAPAEWLSGKRSLTRVPCWPLSGLSLHIVHGEQLLQVVDIDICGTTTVKLQLPPSLTSSKELNFIMVMLVDRGKVGPATQLLTMPSSAADEFCGLFSMLVEHEMLPRSAAHPEFVSMLFGSSGCSSGSTLPTLSGKLTHDGESSAAAVACWDAGSSAAAAAAAAGVLSPWQQQQQQSQLRHLQLQQHTVASVALLQGNGVGNHSSRRHGSHRQTNRRRHSIALCIAGRPAVVQQWASSNPAAGSGVQGTAGLGSQGSTTARGCGFGRERRASDSDAVLHLVPDNWIIDEHVTTDSGGSGGHEMLADDCDFVSTKAAAANAAQVAGLLFFVDDGDASSDGTAAAVPMPSHVEPWAAVQTGRCKTSMAESLHADTAGAMQTGSRKSLSLDRCAMHVHNEVDRAQRTRTRLSLDEGIWTRAASRAASRAGGSGAAAVGPVTAPSSWLAADLLEGMWSRMGVPAAASDGTFAATAAATSEAAIEDAWGGFGADPAAAPAAATSSPEALAVTAADPCGRLVLTSGDLAAAAVSSSAAAAADSGRAAQAGAAAAPKLERLSAAEADMAAAFTAAWTRHMLELASDLQYLVVCVPWAFAGHFEAWFGRIVNARGSSEGRDSSSLVQPSAVEQRSESTWDSAMYMRRLGEVMDTLQMHSMWVTMSLLLQHCWQGGLDLYPAGQLFNHLQQQQQWSPYQPMDPDIISPEYLQQIGSQNIGPASGWIRPVPADPTTADQNPGPGNLGPVTVAAARVSNRRSSFSSAADLSRGMAAERAAAAAAANVRRRSVEQPTLITAASRSSSSSTVGNAEATAASGNEAQAGPQQQQQQQQQRRRRRPSNSSSRSNALSKHRAPRRSVSWPLEALYSAFSWAQNAQRKHRQRTAWQRAAWQLHTLHEESERGSTSTACTSSFDTYRSSTSTLHSSGTATPAAAAAGTGSAADADAATAGRSSRGSLGIPTAAAAAGSTSGVGVIQKPGCVAATAATWVPANAAAASAAAYSGRQFGPIALQHHQPLQQPLLQQLSARQNALLLAPPPPAAAAAAAVEPATPGFMTRAVIVGPATRLEEQAPTARHAAGAAATSIPLPCCQQQQQSMSLPGQQQPLWWQQQQQRWLEPGGVLSGSSFASQGSVQQQQQQQQSSYQRWLAGDTVPAAWPAASYPTAGPASHTTPPAVYTAGHPSTEAASKPVAPGAHGSSSSRSIGAAVVHAGSSSADAVVTDDDQHRTAVVLQSSLFGPAPLPKAKVQGLQAGLFAQAKLPQQQLQLLQQQQCKREQQLEHQPQQQPEPQDMDQHHQQHGQQETSLVPAGGHMQSAVQAATHQAAAIEAAAAAVMRAAAAAPPPPPDAAARTCSRSNRADSRSMQELQVAPAQQQQSPADMQLKLQTALCRHAISDLQQQQQQESLAGGHQQQQQQGRARPSFDYAPHTPGEQQPHLSFDRVMRSSCDKQQWQQQQQRYSVDAHDGLHSKQQQQQQQQQQQATIVRQPLGLLHEQRHMMVSRGIGCTASHTPAATASTTAEGVQQDHAPSAASAGRHVSELHFQAGTDDMFSASPWDSSRYAESAVRGTDHAEVADCAAQDASSSEEAVQQRTGVATTLQGKYEMQAAAAAAAAVSTAVTLAAASRVEQAVSRLLVVLVLLYCLCYLPSLLPGLQPQHIQWAMAARPGWFEPVLLTLLAVHMYMGQTLVNAQTGCNAGQGSTGVTSEATTGDSSRVFSAAAAAGETVPPAGSGSGSGSSFTSRPSRASSFTGAAVATAAAGLTAGAPLTSKINAQQQQQQLQCFTPTKLQQRQERQRQRRRLARQQVLLLRCVMSAASGAAAAGMSCYSLMLFARSSLELWGRLQQCGWDVAASAACRMG